MDDQACPRCKTTKYRNPSLKLLVNFCGHALCDSCVELLFVKGSATCPVCDVVLKRNSFRTQMFEDAIVEKEVDIRKKILRDYNKKEDDFDNLNDYNDYLEQVENIIYNLTHNIQLESTKLMVEQYKRDNKTQIQKNKSKLSKDEEMILEMIDEEQAEVVHRRQILMQVEKQEKNMKIKQKESLIDDLMFSDAPANHILASHAIVQKKAEIVVKNPTLPFKMNLKFAQRDAFLPLPRDETPLYAYEKVNLDLCGPAVPEYSALDCGGYLKNIRSAGPPERAGGYVANLACFRALQDAMSGLYCE